eukprot:PhM_4_TR11402/c0_g1_i1/m.71254
MATSTTASSSLPPEQTFSLRPHHRKRFRPQLVKEVIRRVLLERLGNQDYNPDTVQTTSKDVADVVREQLRGLDMDGYKLIVNAVIGEQRGQGLKMGCRCFWDQDTDGYAEETYTNSSLFAVVTVFGIYHY